MSELRTRPFHPLWVLEALQSIQAKKEATRRLRSKPRGPNRITSMKIGLRLRSRLSAAVRRGEKNGSAVRDLGCTMAELLVHLERQFQPGMTWQNYGIGKDRWQIDHIFPVSKAKLTDREELLRVCHYTNLQPLWHSENSRKGARLPDDGTATD